MKFDPSLAQDRKFNTLIVIFISFSMAGWSAVSIAKKDNSVEQLTTALLSQDTPHIVSTLRTLKTVNSDDMILFIQDLWRLDKNKHPNLPWHLISKDIIRVNIAEIVLISRWSDLIKVNNLELETYILKLLNNPNQEIVTSAITTLSIIENDNTVKKLNEIANLWPSEHAQVAVMMLVKMCHKNAAEALDQLERNSQQRDMLDFIRSHRANWGRFKAKQKITCLN